VGGHLQMNKKIKVAVIGVTGYSGSVLLDFLAKHSAVSVEYICSSSNTGKCVFSVNPSLIGLKDKIPEFLSSPDELPVDEEKLDCVFTCTPNGVSTQIAERFQKTKIKLIDLSADFRLKESSVFEEWYPGLKHPNKDLMKDVAYGLTEWNRQEIKNCKILANPGCYPTASALAILPLLRNKLVTKDNIIIDAKSGTTGAGRKLADNMLFSEVAESFSAYAVEKHRHTPEIEQSLNLFGNTQTVLKFTPHLLPVKRGILSTIYLKPKKTDITENELFDCLKSQYKDEKFVKIFKNPPNLKDVNYSNRCHIAVRYDQRTQTVILFSAIDNLIKGAAGQAMQNFNSMFNFDESLGLY